MLPESSAFTSLLVRIRETRRVPLVFLPPPSFPAAFATCPAVLA